IGGLPSEVAPGLPYRSENQGVMHACGHDIHTSVMLGAALLLKEREAELPGRVGVLFLPAEENFGGGENLIPPRAVGGVSAVFWLSNETRPAGGGFCIPV
ncbi:M20/M25/M40 family metallo-hydrolase, partial [Pseudomonas aeruginosa]|uniref:M20/M25/M40 family metallo-hydrolase n=1 Tax=Pseudomonas aeruginosa TaxID=287 RepID=UPI001CA495FD